MSVSEAGAPLLFGLIETTSERCWRLSLKRHDEHGCGQDDGTSHAMALTEAA